MFQKRKFLFATAALFCFAALFWVNALTVKAQEFSRSSITSVATNTPKKGGKKAAKTQRVVVQIKIITKSVKVKTSNLTVSTQFNADVLIERLDAKGTPFKPVKATKKQSNEDSVETATVEFENLVPGNYKITSSLDGFDTQEAEVLVPKEKTIGISLDLEPIKYQLAIETNVSDGEVRYAPAELKGKDLNGKLSTKETGGYCIAPIKNGKALIQELRKGYYNIDIRPSPTAIEYQPVLTAVNVPNEAEESYNIPLEKKISTETFATAWTANDWVLPGGWRLDKALKTSNAAGIALPRSDQYRYYTDFEMVSDVKSNDGDAISFVMRAVDAQNYYLIQIFGAKAAEPFVAKGYIVKDGKTEQIFSNPIEHFATTIKAGKSFRVIIRGKDNKFEVSIEDSATADVKPVGNIIDRDNNFRKGAVGIASLGNANFQVDSFTVCASLCR